MNCAMFLSPQVGTILDSNPMNGTRTLYTIIGESIASGRILIILPLRPLLISFGLPLGLFLPRQTGNLQPKAKRAEALHENLTLIRSDGRNVHRSPGKHQGEAFVGIGGLALAPQYLRTGKHGIERIGTPSVSYLRTRERSNLGGRLLEPGSPRAGFQERDRPSECT